MQNSSYSRVIGYSNLFPYKYHKQKTSYLNKKINLNVELVSPFHSFFIDTFIAKSTSRHANVGASGSLNVLTVGRAAVHFNEFTDHGLTFVECASRLRSFPFHRNKNRTLTRCGSERLSVAASRVVLLKY